MATNPPQDPQPEHRSDAEFVEKLSKHMMQPCGPGLRKVYIDAAKEVLQRGEIKKTEQIQILQDAIRLAKLIEDILDS